MPRLRKCGKLPSLQRRMSVALLIPVIRAISLGGTGCSSCCRRSRTVLSPAAMAGVNEGSTSSGEDSTALRRFRRFVSADPLGRPRLRGCSVTCITAILMSRGCSVNSTKVTNHIFVLAKPVWAAASFAWRSTDKIGPPHSQNGAPPAACSSVRQQVLEPRGDVFQTLEKFLLTVPGRNRKIRGAQITPPCRSRHTLRKPQATGRGELKFSASS